MKPGNYQLVETKAPEGYQLDASPINFIIEKLKLHHYKLQFQIKNCVFARWRGKPITPPNNEDHKGNKTSEEQAIETNDQQLNKQKMIKIWIKIFQIQVIKKILHKQ